MNWTKKYIKEFYQVIVGGWQTMSILRISILFLIGLTLALVTIMGATAATDQTTICGDKFCDATETLNSCPGDCMEQIPLYASCAFNTDKCVDENMRSNANNILIILFVLGTIIYLKVKKFI